MGIEKLSEKHFINGNFLIDDFMGAKYKRSLISKWANYNMDYGNYHNDYNMIMDVLHKIVRLSNQHQYCLFSHSFYISVGIGNRKLFSHNVKVLNRHDTLTGIWICIINYIQWHNAFFSKIFLRIENNDSDHIISEYEYSLKH